MLSVGSRLEFYMLVLRQQKRIRTTKSQCRIISATCFIIEGTSRIRTYKILPYNIASFPNKCYRLTLLHWIWWLGRQKMKWHKYHGWQVQTTTDFLIIFYQQGTTTQWPQKKFQRLYRLLYPGPPTAKSSIPVDPLAILPLPSTATRRKGNLPLSTQIITIVYPRQNTETLRAIR